PPPGNQSSLDLEELLAGLSYGGATNATYGDYGDPNATYGDYGDPNATYGDYSGASPCRSRFCPLLQRLAPPFLAASCSAAALGTAALLLALLRCPPRAWQSPPGRALVAQQALGTVLAVAPLPALAAGIAQGWHLGAGPCRLARLLWHWGVFAQALLWHGGGCGAGTGTAGGRWTPGAWPWPPWAVALVAAVPAALAGGTVAGTACVRRAVGALHAAYLLHVGTLAALLVLLPLAALARPAGTAGTAGTAGAAPWVFWALWAPYGAGLAVELLLQAGPLVPSCATLEGLDHVLGVSEGLGVLHCALAPALLLLPALGRRGAGWAHARWALLQGRSRGPSM
ncbi:LOW QUALITY PROTEIN: atypical chemokine receptor 1-like, partial [Manacus candei]|uniref:LOW QUALITY PROTEIN: atypical chemokine receptor 1-like n=1 Tax=Manacus candei TaxID=415023 RepID=UPI0022260768